MTTSALTVYGADWCRDCRRTKALLENLAVDFAYIDLEQDQAAAVRAQEISGMTRIPVVVYPDGTHQVEPTDDAVRTKLAELATSL